MDNEKEVVVLLIKMIDLHGQYGDNIGYTRSEISKFVNKYDLINLDYLPEDLLILYKYGFVDKKFFNNKICEFFDDLFSGYSSNSRIIDEYYDNIEYIDFLESNNIVNLCINKMIPSNIKQENGKWYFYAYNGWSYFEDYFKSDSNNRSDVPKMLLNGEGFELFQYDCSVFDDFQYLDIIDSNLKFLKSIVQNMKDDFDIEQNDIDDIKDIDDVYHISKNYGIDELERALQLCYCDAQRNADENEAYESIINQIYDYFGFVGDKGVDWVKMNNKDYLKLEFINEEKANESIILLFKIDNIQYGSEDFLIDYESPYYGWNGDANKYINDEFSWRIEEEIDNKYIPKNDNEKMKIQKINELFFDNNEIDDGKIRFYLLNTDTNKGFAFDADRDDKEDFERLFKKNNITYDIDDGVYLPF